MGNTQWRQLEKGGSWTDENYVANLVEEIGNQKVRFGDIQRINILLVGPVQAGKSSFINSVASIDKERTAQPVKAERDGMNVTKKFEPYIPRNKLKNFALFDTVGVHDLSVADFKSAVEGNIMNSYKFKPASPIEEGHKLFNNKPSNKDKMHCVVFVLPANVVGQENLSTSTRYKLEQFRDILKEYDSVTKIVLLTKTDVLETKVNKDIAATYESSKVKYAVGRAEDLFGVSSKKAIERRWTAPEELTLIDLVLSHEEELFGCLKGPVSFTTGRTEQRRAILWAEIIDTLNSRNTNEKRSIGKVKKKFHNIKQRVDKFSIIRT